MHPLKDLTGPLATQFVVVTIVACGVVIWGLAESWRGDEDSVYFDWERVLVALLEVTFGLVALWKVDQWVRLLMENGGAR